jgi:hypothetical protein
MSAMTMCGHEQGYTFHCYRRENIKSYIVVLYGRLIITFDEATACQLRIHGTRHENGDNVARGSLPRP